LDFKPGIWERWGERCIEVVIARDLELVVETEKLR
jgi:hypothetical protein